MLSLLSNDPLSPKLPGDLQFLPICLWSQTVTCKRQLLTLKTMPAEDRNGFKKCLETFGHERALMNSWGEVGGKWLEFSGHQGSNSHAQRSLPHVGAIPKREHCSQQTYSVSCCAYFLCHFLMYLESFEFSLCFYCIQFPVYFLDYWNVLLSRLNTQSLATPTYSAHGCQNNFSCLALRLWYPVTYSCSGPFRL